ncbi:MAG TPA: hypothetical protein DDW36_03145 [Candidatus Magasanikbacteria bacterium]|nr:hypothetical protein [Candidatus Magasanikbacteria bacterium]
MEKHSTYLHHGNPRLTSTVREVVFGLEDGMVSTLGVITGIAVGTQNQFVVILSGFVLIAVEALSMGAGSYLSSKSVKEVEERKLAEEKEELERYPAEEQKELAAMYCAEGLTAPQAAKIAAEVSKHKQLLLKEMAHSELKIIPDALDEPRRNALLMGLSYIVGGLIPVAPYFFRSVLGAIPFSVVITLVGLFLVGAARTKYTAQRWWKSGLELMMVSAGAALVGYLVAKFVEMAFGVPV